MSLDTTALNAFQDDTAVQTEIKALNHGLIQQAKSLDAGATWLGPTVRQKLSTIFNQAFQLPALKEEVITILDEESFNIPINQSTSETITATKVTMFTGFRWYPSSFGNNLISEQEYKMNKYMEMFKAFGKKKEAYIQTNFETLKTQILNVTGSTGYNFDTGTDGLEITKAAQTDTMALDLGAILRQNDLNGSYNISSGYGLQFVINQITKYGAGNEKNLQALGLPDIFYSNQITKAAPDNWTGYAAMNGAIGMVENYLPDFVAGKTVGTASFGITDRPVPFLDERIMMFQNEGLGNASSLGTSSTELKMTHYKEEGFISNFFIIGKYNSDRTNRVGDIIKLNGLTA